MRFLLICFCVVSITVPVAFMVLGPSARQHGADRATLVIEASACGDTTGVVAEGWEERCSERAASRTNN